MKFLLPEIDKNTSNSKFVSPFDSDKTLGFLRLPTALLMRQGSSFFIERYWAFMFGIVMFYAISGLSELQQLLCIH